MHRVYGARWIRNGGLFYVGSSYLPLEELEYNHRNWETIDGYEGTKFRRTLLTMPDEIAFETLEELQCTRALIELIEQEYIITFNPPLNTDTKPFQTSWKTYGRFDIGTANKTISEYNELDREYAFG